MLSLVLVTTRKADFLFQGQDLGNGCRAITEHRIYPISILTDRPFWAGGGVAWRARTRAGAAPNYYNRYQPSLSSSQLASFRKWCGVVDGWNSDCICFPGVFRFIPGGDPGVARTLGSTTYCRCNRGCGHDNSCLVSHWPDGCSLVRRFPVGHAG